LPPPNRERIGRDPVYQNGQISALGSFKGQNLYQAQRINNRGQILALYEVANGTIGTIIYNGGQMQEIVPPCSIQGDIVGEVINDRGVVLGRYGLSPGAPDKGYFIFTNGTFHNLGTYSHLLLAMNNSGQIVGAGAASYPSVAILSDGIGDQDLNKLIDPTAGVTLREATGIDDSGQICGWGYDAAGNLVGFLLTPIK
jgi:hypothetical protein